MKYEEDLRKLENNCTDGLVALRTEDKGYGVFATNFFKKNEFLCEYKGQIECHIDHLGEFCVDSLILFIILVLS